MSKLLKAGTSFDAVKNSSCYLELNNLIATASTRKTFRASPEMPELIWFLRLLLALGFTESKVAV